MPLPPPRGEELLGALRARFPESQCTHCSTIPARPAHYAPWPQWVLPELREHLEGHGIARLYAHQAEAAEAAHAGQHAIMATGTSSGKSLGYLLPVLTDLARDPTACALYLTPTKALGSDQLRQLRRLCRAVGPLRGVHPAPYDGDTPAEARAGIREQSRFVLSNPDMVHSSMLAHHPRWARLWRRLRYVIVDESHMYRGVFGAHVSLVLRRLRRLAAHYGSNPTFILASATSADPAEHASLLTGLGVRAIADDASPAGARTVVLWEPGFLPGHEGEQAAPVRRSAASEAAGLMAALVAQGARTLTFVRSRRSAEATAMLAAEDLAVMGKPLAARQVRSYRAGYLAEDRREVERQLDSGELVGVATTNALELGIDVGGLDAVVTAGFPGTVASLWQQAGRAGRRGQDSLVVLVARDDPLDTYLVHHPAALLQRPLERAVFDPHNPHVLREHLYCAAVELPLTPQDVEDFAAAEVIDDLTAHGLLRRRPRGWFAVGDETTTAHGALGLRGNTSGDVLIADTSDGRLLGTIDATRAPAQVHPGAIYLHQGESYIVDALDLDDAVALVRPTEVDYTTFARSTTAVRVLGDALPPRPLVPGVHLRSIDVEVSRQVIGYVVRRPDGTLMDTVALDMPTHTLRTRAVAYTLTPDFLEGIGLPPAQWPGALHAAEHAAIGMLPLLATCDRWDIGGLSTTDHPDTALPTVFVYDGHPGGAGFADCGFKHFPTWIKATHDAVRSCACEEGCPSCVQSPKCGNGNQPLSKAGAVRLLETLVRLSSCELEPLGQQGRPPGPPG
ncbi:DEAD/DEAH box helicase [Corynebacterium oculi]|uniref:Putative ATP-dependent helicase Lhr n=1 Tax=Corynebacterium oculi TaxID=1544416 RepID=A0A0Q0UDB7_9CORY|nr:DEAD/DEAH box helicase [Corynebacterium oculi]KQB84484.1 putative ATP-dependent helicase Lhr [Corynebacterium oculi]